MLLLLEWHIINSFSPFWPTINQNSMLQLVTLSLIRVRPIGHVYITLDLFQHFVWDVWATETNIKWNNGWLCLLLKP